MPAWTLPCPSTLAASASRTVNACSGCQGGRSSALRWTAAAIASHGSSGETGASEPRASRTPASTIQRNAKHRSARSGQHSSVTSRSSSRCAGWTLARSPSRAISGQRRRGVPAGRARSSPSAPVASYAASASRRARSPIAWVATSSPCACARSSRRVSSALVWLAAPAPEPSAYSSQHQAVRVLSEPSEMIFSGPIVIGVRRAGEHVAACAARPRSRRRARRRTSRPGRGPASRAAPSRPPSGRARGRRRR